MLSAVREDVALPFQDSAPVLLVAAIGDLILLHATLLGMISLYHRVELLTRDRLMVASAARTSVPEPVARRVAAVLALHVAHPSGAIDFDVVLKVHLGQTLLLEPRFSSDPAHQKVDFDAEQDGAQHHHTPAKQIDVGIHALIPPAISRAIATVLNVWFS